MIFPSTTVTVTTSNSICAPAVLSLGCTSLDTINNFILVGESNTQINHLNSGCATNNYDNRTSLSVTLFTSRAYTAFVSSQYQGQIVGIWIDFDNSLVFESNERVALETLNGTINTQVLLTIPMLSANVLSGTHRMRVSLAYAMEPNPCGKPATYGEIHDYTVNIRAYSCKLNYFIIKFFLLLIF